MATRRRVVSIVIVALALIATVIAVSVMVLSPCRQQRDAERLKSALANDPDLGVSDLALVGFCDDENPYYAVQGRTPETVSSFEKRFESLGCRRDSDTGGQGASLDFDAVSDLRMLCSRSNAAFRISVNPRGDLYESPRGPYRTVFFLPVS